MDNRDSDSETDRMLKNDTDKKTGKKKKSRPAIIAAASGGPPGGSGSGTPNPGSRVSVVVTPAQQDNHKQKKSQVKMAPMADQEPEFKTPSDNSSQSTAALATQQASSSTEPQNKDDFSAQARKRKATPAPHRTGLPGRESPKPPAWSHVFHVTPSSTAPPVNNQPPEGSSSLTMERYLNEQFRQWSAQSEAGDTIHYPYLPPMQKTWSPAAGVAPPLTTFTLHEGKLGRTTLPDSGRWTRAGGGGGMTTDDEEEQTPLSPFRRITYSKQVDIEKSAKKRRVVEKDGDPNVEFKNISERRRRYISDFYTTLVDSSWPGTLLLFALSFFVSWLFFGTIYYFISWHHGDFEPDHLPANQSNSGWKPCIWEIENFASCYLYSLETQHTIGYGSRQTTNLCLSAMITMSFQSIVGCLIQAFMVGLVFAKLSRPRQRSRTVVFSKQAVICERNRKLCLIFRVGDMRQDSFIVNAQVSVKVIQRKVTEEGEMYHDVSPLKITPDSSCEPCVFMVWPFTLVHEIDEDSPFYRHSAADLARDKFELHVSLEGTIESTSMNFQARTSYLPNEIYWGHRFEPMMLYRRDHNKYQINFSAFHSTYEVDTPLCSAYELEKYYKAKDQMQQQQLHGRTYTNTSAPNTLPSQLKKHGPGSLAPSAANQMVPPMPRSQPPPMPTMSPQQQQFNFIAGSEESKEESSGSSADSTAGSSSSKSVEETVNDDGIYPKLHSM